MLKLSLNETVCQRNNNKGPLKDAWTQRKRILKCAAFFYKAMRIFCNTNIMIEQY